jgi:RNA polymerase sigma factor (sigma-70 family)
MELETQHQRFDGWMADHIAILYRTVNGFAEGEDRKDLMQEVMLAVWKAIPAFREQAKASTFIYRVAHNAALTWKRTQKNYRRKLDQFEMLMPPVMHLPPQNVDHELLESLYAAIRQLAPLDRSLALLFLDDVSYREMAEIHGLTETNVGVRMNRLKQKLALLMKESSHGF